MVDSDGGALDAALRSGESEVVEFKESLDNEAIEGVNAFANTRGGTVFVGVADDATVKGVTLGKETLVSKRTASRELAELVQKEILAQVGLTGKGTFYGLK